MWATSQSRALGALGGVLGAVALACGDGLGADRGERQASLSFAVPRASALATTANLAAIVITGTNARTVDIQSVDIVFSEITLEGRDVEPDDDDDSDVDSDSEHQGNGEFDVGAATVSLPLEGGVITPFTGNVPIGTFDRVEMDAEFARIRGTVDGQPFDVTVAIDKELELKFEPPLVVGDTPDPINVTVNIDVASWFKNAAGEVIDPRALSTDSELRSQFRQRVAQSFKAFEDEDLDADEDDSDSDSENDTDNSGPG